MSFNSLRIPYKNPPEISSETHSGSILENFQRNLLETPTTTASKNLTKLPSDSFIFINSGTKLTLEISSKIYPKILLENLSRISPGIPRWIFYEIPYRDFSQKCAPDFFGKFSSNFFKNHKFSFFQKIFHKISPKFLQEFLRFFLSKILQRFFQKFPQEFMDSVNKLSLIWKFLQKFH